MDDIMTVKDPATLENNLTVQGNVRLGNSTVDTVGFYNVSGVVKASAPTVYIPTTINNTTFSDKSANITLNFSNF